MPSSLRLPALLAATLSAGLFVASTAPARATAFCDVRKTADGFVALRAAPDPQARLIARMRVGDELMVRDDVAARAGWMFVTWWKGGRFKVKRETGYDPSDANGWVHAKLIAEECG